MGTLEEEIGRQRRSERAEEDDDIQREASIRPSANLRRAIADFLAKGVPPTGEYPTGGTTERSRFFGSQGITEPGWVLFYRMHEDAPGAPNVLMTAGGEIRFSAGFGEPFLPLKGSDSQLCGFPSTGDQSTAQAVILTPGTDAFDDSLIEALAGLVRSDGQTSGPVDQ
jgi:hypothetical protein